jgi:hypothetical protein
VLAYVCVLWINLNGTTRFSDGIIELALVSGGNTQVVGRVYVLWINLDGITKFDDGVIELALISQGKG